MLNKPSIFVGAMCGCDDVILRNYTVASCELLLLNYVLGEGHAPLAIMCDVVYVTGSAVTR